jgi:hypothetical protein
MGLVHLGILITLILYTCSMWDTNLASAYTTNLPSIVSLFHIDQTLSYTRVSRVLQEKPIFLSESNQTCQTKILILAAAIRGKMNSTTTC